MRRANVPAILREGNFARYLVASSVSTLGSGMSTVALAFAVLGMGGVTDLGIILLAREIPLILFVLLGGVFADRMRRRTILVSTDLVKAIAQGLTALLFFSGSADLLTVVILQVMFGTASAFSGPATTGLVREISSDSTLQEANALLSLSRSILYIVGPAVGALIVAAGSPALALAVDAVSFLVSALFTFSLRLPGVVRMVAASLLDDLRGGWREFVERRWAVAMVLSFGLFQLTYFPALNVLGPSVAQTELGGPTSWGLILALEAVGAVIGGAVSLRLKVVRPLVACQLFVVPSGLLLIGLAVPLPVAVLVVMSAAVGFGFAAGNTYWMTALQQNVPEHALSRISSFDWLGSVAFNPVGYALVGPLALAIGTPETLVACGVMNVIAAVGVIFVPSVRRIRMVSPGATPAPLPEAGTPYTELG